LEGEREVTQWQHTHTHTHDRFVIGWLDGHHSWFMFYFPLVRTRIAVHFSMLHGKQRGGGGGGGGRRRRR
jgi:hypothetical protein